MSLLNLPLQTRMNLLLSIDYGHIAILITHNSDGAYTCIYLQKRLRRINAAVSGALQQ